MKDKNLTNNYDSLSLEELTNEANKMIEDLENGEIELPSKELEPQCYREFSLYSYKLSPNGKLSFSHTSGENDDIVDSICMANYARNTMLRGSSIHIGTGNMNVVPKFGLPT